MMEDCLELSDDQFDKLTPKMQLKVIYVNVKAIAGLKRIQKMQWLCLGGLASAMAWLFFQLWSQLGSK
jgi:hypothetical protein